MRLLRMKNRIYFLFIGVIVFTSLLLILSSNPKSHSEVVQSIVQETQNGINIFKNQFKTQLLDKVDKKYLEEVFDEENVWWPDKKWRRNSSEPVIVSAIRNGQSGDAVQFLRNSLLFLPNHTIVLYDLGISQHEFDHVSKFCNSSKCFIREFPFDSFPSHVKNLKTTAYRPIIIQLVLKDVGSVLWLDIRHRLTSGDLNLSEARESGVLSWAMEQPTPTSALTHPKMFEYLDQKPEDYNFQHMVDLNALILYNTKEIHSNLMDSWVKCALLEECIEPIGAQSTGCRFDKKPGFRYSGCHGYDVSAFNVVIGQLFKFDESKYTSRQKFFVKMSEDSEVNNTTTISPYLPSDESRRKIRTLLFKR